MVADLRTDIRSELAMAHTIGSGLGSALGSVVGRQERQKKEYEKLYLESANELFIQTLSLSSAENWSNEKRHAAITQIKDWAKTKAGEKYGLSLMKGTGQDVNDVGKAIQQW